MAEPRVFFVHLRRPRNAKVNPDERRDDPFYEFGSFGCTGCHSKNLLHLRHVEELTGARLAFVQGGRLGFRLVLLTPPISVVEWKNRCEAKWAPAKMPFKYTQAPMLVQNGGRSDFPMIEQYAWETARSTIEGGFSSRFRSRVRPLPCWLAKEVVMVYQLMRAASPSSAFASTYDEALPYAPPKIDRDRKATYQGYICELAGRIDSGEDVSFPEMPQQKTPDKYCCGLSQCRKYD